MFGCLKTRGFCLEATHVTDPDRLRKLLALVALAFCWAHIVGEWLSAQRPLPVKKHGRKTVSIFRHGLDHLRRILGRVRDDLFGADADEDFADPAQGADGVGQHHGYAPEVSALIELRAHGEKEVDCPLGLKSRDSRLVRSHGQTESAAARTFEPEVPASSQPLE